MIIFLLVSGLLILTSMVLCSFRLFNFLVVLEMFNLLVLVSCIMLDSGNLRVVFMSMMALFVLEVSIVLSVVGSKLCGGLYEGVVDL